MFFLEYQSIFHLSVEMASAVHQNMQKKKNRNPNRGKCSPFFFFFFSILTINVTEKTFAFIPFKFCGYN